LTQPFGIGDRVRVRDVGAIGHNRTPRYVRGKVGFIERCCGAFPNPEALAYGGDGLPKKHLFRVRFLQKDIWPNYEGTRRDAVEVEIYEHWLQGVEKP